MAVTIYFDNVNENCTVYINDILIEDGVETDVPYSADGYFLKIVANEGYVFGETLSGYLSYRDLNAGKNRYMMIGYDDTEYWNEDYTIFEREFTGISGEINIRGNLVDITLIEESSSIEPVDLTNVFVGLYSPTVDELEELSEEYHTLIFFGPEWSSIIVHASEFVSKLYIIPFNVESIVTPDTAPIQLGGKNLATQAKHLTTSVMKVEVCSIYVPAEYGNVYDYINTTCYIHLPFTTKKELDIARVIEKTITVVYNIDLYTGMATCNIRADGELLESFQLNLAREIPFRSNRTEPDIVGSPGGVLINNVETPYIELVRNIPYNEVGEFSNNIVEYTELNKVNGYVEVQKINLVGKATKREKQEIERLLTSGVFIK